MADYKIISKQIISNSEVSNLLNEKSKETELTYREEKTKDYLKKFSKLDVAKFNKVKEEIITLDIPRLEIDYILKIVDILPKNGTELRSIVSNTGTILVDENVDKIINVLNKYR